MITLEKGKVYSPFPKLQKIRFLQDSLWYPYHETKHEIHRSKPIKLKSREFNFLKTNYADIEKNLRSL